MSYIKLKLLKASLNREESTSIHVGNEFNITLRDEQLWINIFSAIKFINIKSMEVSRDILLIMEKELRELPFDVICPENDEYNKALKEATEGLMGEFNL